MGRRPKAIAELLIKKLCGKSVFTPPPFYSHYFTISNRADSVWCVTNSEHDSVTRLTSDLDG